MTHRNSALYNRLMVKAAQGNREAAYTLLRDGWFPGDPESTAEHERIMAHAKELGYAR